MGNNSLALTPQQLQLGGPMQSSTPKDINTTTITNVVNTTNDSSVQFNKLVSSVFSINNSDSKKHRASSSNSNISVASRVSNVSVSNFNDSATSSSVLSNNYNIHNATNSFYVGNSDKLLEEANYNNKTEENWGPEEG